MLTAIDTQSCVVGQASKTHLASSNQSGIGCVVTEHQLAE